MTKHLQRWVILACLPAFFLCSCKKDLRNTSLTTTGQPARDGFPNYDFDWTTATTMMPSTITTDNPSLPWLSQSGSYIVDPAVASDYLKIDGWYLVYNTFNPSYYLQNAAAGGLYFTLYNIYRGIIRYYLWIPSGTISGSQIQHGLGVYYSGTTVPTSQLNFEGVDVVDPSTNSPSFTKTNNVGVASGGGWYVMQYELAYDQNWNSATNPQSYPTVGMTWNSRTVNITDIQIKGQETGTITGNITQKSDGLGSTILNGVLGTVEYFGSTYSGSNAQLKAMQSAAQNGLAGSVSGFLSGIFGGNSNNTSTVDLKTNDSITLTGTLTTSNPLSPNVFVWPGETIAANNASYPPLYTNRLGVFNLLAKPTIYVHNTATTVDALQGDRTSNGTKMDYSIAAGTATPVINPIVSANATIGTPKYEIILVNPSFRNSVYWVTHNGTSETIGNLKVLSNFTTLTQQGGPLGTAAPGSYMAVRVSFTVTPTNGGKSSLLTKTFLANIVVN